MTIPDLLAAGRYGDVVASVESMRGEAVDISVILAYSHSLEAVGRHLDAFNVLVGLHDSAPREDVARVVVATMCRLSIRDPELLQRLANTYPDSGVIKAGMSEMALQDGDYQTGFDLCRNRWAVTKVRPEIEALPVWDGSPLDGRRLLVSAEQGLGEEILFSRFFGQLPPAIISCDPRLMPLFSRSFPWHEFVPKGTLKNHAVTGCVAIDAMELGRLYDSTALIGPYRWLCADYARGSDMREAISESWPGQKSVGVSWHSQRHNIGDSKSIPVADLIPLLSADAVFFDLQYGDHKADLAVIREAGRELFGITGLDVTQDIDGLASLITALDVVVTCSNTTAHLAGALGKRTILLAPGGKFVLWYWGLDGASTPWYPSIEILRGPPRCSWAELTNKARGMI